MIFRGIFQTTVLLTTLLIWLYSSENKQRPQPPYWLTFSLVSLLSLSLLSLLSLSSLFSSLCAHSHSALSCWDIRAEAPLQRSSVKVQAPRLERVHKGNRLFTEALGWGREAGEARNNLHRWQRQALPETSVPSEGETLRLKKCVAKFCVEED